MSKCRKCPKKTKKKKKVNKAAVITEEQVQEDDGCKTWKCWKERKSKR